MADPEFKIPEFSYTRRKREAAFDPLMRRIALSAGGIATLVILVALVWGGMKPGLHFGPPPVIDAPAGPLRVAPADPGGLTVPGADQQIMSGQDGATPNALSPAGPSPDISAFQAPPAPAAVNPAPAPPAASATQSQSQGASALAPVSPPLPVPPLPAAIGKVQVQLAAAVDPASARAAWAKLNSQMPGLFSGHAPLYSHAKVAGVEFWRLRVGGFADIATARQFCASVRAQHGACTVATF